MNNKHGLFFKTHPLIIRLLATIFLLSCTVGILLAGIHLVHPEEKTLTLEANAPGTNRYFIAFYAPETSAHGTYRWSSSHAALLLPPFGGQPAILDMHLSSPRPSEEPFATTFLSSDAWESTSFMVGREWRHYQVLIPHVDEKKHTVELQVSPFNSKTHDDRSLGVALSHFKATLPNTIDQRIASITQFPFILHLFLPTLMYIIVGQCVQTFWQEHQSRNYAIHLIAVLSFIFTLVPVILAIIIPTQTKLLSIVLALWCCCIVLVSILINYRLRFSIHIPTHIADIVQKPLVQQASQPLYWLMFTIILLCNVGLSGYLLNAREFGIESFLYSHYAENYVNFGYIETKLGLVQDLGESKPSADHQVTHPWLGHGIYPDRFHYRLSHGNVTSLLISFAYHIFGVHRWSMRLMPLLLAIGSTICIFLLSRRIMKNRWSALLAFFFFALLPIQIYWANYPITEQVSIFFCIVAFYCYWCWFSSQYNRYLYGFFAAVVIGTYTDWNAYFVFPAVFAHYVVWSQKPRNWWFITSLILSPVMLFVSYIVWTSWLLGYSSLDPLADKFLYRSDSAGNFGDTFTQEEFVAAFYPRFKYNLTPTVLYAALFWLLQFLFRSIQRRVSANQAMIFVLSLFVFFRFVIFKNHTLIHPHTVYYIGAFFAVAAAATITWFVGRYWTKKPTLVVLTVTIFLYLFVEQSIITFTHSKEANLALATCNYTHEDRKRHLLAHILRETIPGKSAFVSSVSLYPEDMIANRRYVVANTLEQFLFVTKTDSTIEAALVPNTNTTDTRMREYLVEHYPRQDAFGFSIFDLTQQASNVLVSEPNIQHPRAITFGNQIEFLGFDIEEVVYRKRDQFHWIKQYLEGCPEQLPPNRTTFRVAHYWRKINAGPVNYTLVTDFDTQIGPPYHLEQSDNGLDDVYPTSLWEQGQIIREEFEVEVPLDSPERKYALWVSVQNGPDSLAPEGHKFNADSLNRVLVGHVDIRPSHHPTALKNQPLPQNETNLQVNKDIHMLGYSLDVTENGIHIMTNWKKTSHSNNDFDLMVRLQNKNNQTQIDRSIEIASPRLWQEHHAYQGEIVFSPYLFNGEYTLSLVVQDEQGTEQSFPLTTMSWYQHPETNVPAINYIGQPDNSSKDTFLLAPGEPKIISFDLPKPQDVEIVLGWTGKTQYRKARIFVMAQNSIWSVGNKNKFLKSFIVHNGKADVVHVRVPQKLTTRGHNSIMLYINPATAGDQRYLSGWRRILATAIPDLHTFLNTNYLLPGWAELDFIQILEKNPRVPT